MIDTELFRQYAEYKAMKKHHEDEADKCASKMKDMVGKIHSMLAAEGSDSVTVDGVRFTPYTKMRARHNGIAALIEAFESEDLGSLVTHTVNANTLSSWVNEFNKDKMLSAEEVKEKIPEEIRDHIQIYEQPMLSVSKS